PLPRPDDACTQCIKIRFEVTNPLSDFKVSNQTCNLILQHLAIKFNSIVQHFNLSKTITTTTISSTSSTTTTSANFSVDPENCYPTSINICGEFGNWTSVDSTTRALLSDQFYFVTDNLIGQLIGYLCRGTMGLSIYSVSLPENCFDVEVSRTCRPPALPPPPCKCNQTIGIMPYYTLPTVRTESGRKNGATLYCFSIAKVQPFDPRASSCGSSDLLDKIEIYANDTLRRKINGIRLTPNNNNGNGTSRWIYPNWGAVGTNWLKITPLRWDSSQATGGQFCLELTIPLDTFCARDGTCSVSLFNEDRDCCPVYPAALPYVPVFDLSP
ncbi:hypothetical protein VaNZ11_015115, partial [Volvox africanus]